MSPPRLGGQMHVNEAYKLTRDNDMRNEQIAADVKFLLKKEALRKRMGRLLFYGTRRAC